MRASCSTRRCRSTRRFRSTAPGMACCRDATRPSAVSSPVMWAEALDVMLARARRQRPRPRPARGHLGLGAAARQRLSQRRRRPARSQRSTRRGRSPPQIAPLLSRPVAPIWMDSSTAPSARRSQRPSAAPRVLARHTGSRAFERFTGPQIRKFAATEPAAYAATERVHLVSSFLASLLVGRPRAGRSGRRVGHEPDGSRGRHVVARRRSTRPRPDWPRKLPAIAPSWTDRRHACRRTGRRATACRRRKVIVWSGDNPCSLIGVGLVREGRVAISLGTSDTIFGLMKEPRVDPSGTGHVFGVADRRLHGPHRASATDRWRASACAIAYGLTWTDFSRALDVTPPGNDGARC